MALAEPRPRPNKNRKLEPSQPLPLIKNAAGEIYRFKGIFNGLCVSVSGEEDMKKIVSMGYFGKASLSRGYPEFGKPSPEIIRNRVFQSRKRLSNSENPPQKVIVLPDSDSDTDDTNYFTNLKPEYQLDCSGIKEHVNLGLEEAFFLAAALNCFDIIHQGRLLDAQESWDLFKQTDKLFIMNYIAYYHFRSKNWVVKSGLKFGGDFLLYKEGPPFYHASYVVIIHVVDENLDKIESCARRSMSNLCLMGLNRLCETAGKELLICEIVCPNDFNLDQTSFQDLPKFAIKETIMKRWIPCKTSQQ